MSHRPTPSSQPFATGVIAGEFAALDAGGVPPAWIKVTPTGRVTTRDGRSYAFDPAALAARFGAEGISVPVDLDHSVQRKAMFGEAGTVVGWVAELQARPDGLFARVDWLDAGKATLAARTHRYVSPTFSHDDAGNATWLHSVALVPAPALAMPAVASAGGSPQEDQPMLKKIAVSLGLAETADEAACLSALTTLRAETVAKAVHDQALANLAAATTAKDAAEAKLATLAADARKAEVDALLEGALTEKKIVPAQREQYAALCATAEGLNQVKALLAATPKGLQASALDNQNLPAGDEDLTDPAKLSGLAAKFVRTQAEAGITISHADAVVAVRDGKHKETKK